MMLRIDSDRLHYRLTWKSEWIGFAPRATHVIAVFEAAFMLLTALTTSMGYWWRVFFVAISLVTIIYALVSAIMTWSKGYNAEELYRELIDMDRTHRRSSIIAISHGNRYLLYHDVNWDCDFFPNHATAATEAENQRLLADYLSTGFDIPKEDFTLQRITGESHEKYSTAHHEVRYYDYTLYRATIKHMPAAWKADRFHVDSKDCVWMTVDEMLERPRLKEVNSDVIGMVRDQL